MQPSNQKLLEEFIDEDEPWLLIGIPSRNPFFVTQYLERHSVNSDQHMKKLMLLREGLHVMMQCNMRQHFADLYWLHEHPEGHASWRIYDQEIHKRINHLLRERTWCRWNVQKMRSESNDNVRKTTGFFTNSWRIKVGLESY